MKKLLFGIALALSILTVRAQSTSVVVRVTVVEPTATNVFNLTANTNQVSGFSLAWARDTMVAVQQTNTPPIFSISVRNEVIARLASLQDQAIADDLLNNKITAAAAQLPTIWPQMTVSERTNVSGIFRKYVQ